MLEPTKEVIGAGSIAVVIAGVAAVTARSPEGFWPVTVTGWLTMATSVCTLVGVGYLLYKKSLSPVVGSISHVEQHFDDKLKELEEKYDREFEQLRRESKQERDAFTQAVHDRLNGMGGRIDTHSAEISAMQTDYEVVNRLLAASIEDRRHINRRLDEISQGQDRIIGMLLNRGLK